MRKSELKVGVEYAVHLKPSDARSNRYYRPEPRKATLVEIDGTVEETLTVVGFDGYGGFKPMPNGPREEVVSSGKGLVVELDKPVTEGVVSPSGRYIQGQRSSYGRGHLTTGLFAYKPVEAHEVEGFDTSEHRREVTRLSLENAGCFVSTWADYLAEQEQAKRWEIEHKDQQARELREAQENEERVQERVVTLIAVLRAKGYEVAADYGYNGDETTVMPEKYLVSTAVEGIVFTIELHYYGGQYRVSVENAARFPLVNATVSKLTVERLLDVLA